MEEKTIIIRIKNKYDTAENWTKNNPILLAGEFGIESDTNRIKIGNGVSTWNDLTYIASGSEGGAIIVDTTLSSTSSNPLANRIITDKITEIEKELKRLDKVKIETEADFIMNGTYIPESDWAEIVNGTYTLD